MTKFMFSLIFVAIIYSSCSSIWCTDKPNDISIDILPVKASSQESLIFISTYKTDKLMKKWHLDTSTDACVLGIMKVGDKKCYVVTSTDLGTPGFASEEWLKEWAYQMVFYEDNKGRLQRLNYLSSTSLTSESNEKERMLKSITALRSFLKTCNIPEKELSKLSIAKIVSYLIAYGSIGSFDDLNYEGGNILAIAGNGKVTFMDNNGDEHTQELNIIKKHLSKSGTSPNEYIIIGKRGNDDYVTYRLIFSKSNKLTFIKITRLKDLNKL